MKLKIQYGTEVCTVPLRAVSEKGAERTDLLVLLNLSACPSLAEDIPALAKKIGCTVKKTESAIDFWIECGIFERADNSPDERKGTSEPSQPHVQERTDPDKKTRFESRPTYDSAEIAAIAAREGGTIRMLIDECQRITEKIFTPSETSKIIGMVDYLGLDLEHILSLFTYCVRRGKKSVSYIEKTAYNLYDEGIDSAAKLEEYIKHKEALESKEAEQKALIGISGRSLVQKERDAFKKWQEEWKLSPDIIRRGYEETVTKTGKYNLAYLSKVLESWYLAGLTTIQKIEESENKFHSDKAKETEEISSGSFDTDEFVALALKRSYDSAAKQEISEK